MKMTARRLIVMMVSLVTISSFGCSGPDGEKSGKGSGSAVVIQIDDQKIDATAVEKYLEKRAIPANVGNAPELLKKRVEELVAEELQYREALRLKLDQDPDTRQKIRDILKQKLSEEQIQKKVMERKIDPAEVQAYYDTHRDEFIRPEEVRLADIFIAVPADASSDLRVELKQKAEKVLAEVLSGANPRSNFPRLIREYSDTPGKYTKGDTGFFNADGKPTEIDPAIVAAGFKLEKSGDVSNAVVEAADGFHILMMNSRRPGFNKTVEQVSGFIERRIRTDEINKRREDYLQELKAKAKIQVDEKAVAQIQEKLKTSGKMMPKPPVNRNFLAVPGNSLPPAPGGAEALPIRPDNRPQVPPEPTGNPPMGKSTTPFDGAKGE